MSSVLARWAHSDPCLLGFPLQRFALLCVVFAVGMTSVPVGRLQFLPVGHILLGLASGANVSGGLHFHPVPVGHLSGRSDLKVKSASKLGRFVCQLGMSSIRASWAHTSRVGQSGLGRRLSLWTTLVAVC